MDSADAAASEWFAVRCLFRRDAASEVFYEERITLWSAPTADAAIQQAEAEAAEYAAGATETEYLGFAQSYWLADEIGSGAEVFSLIRGSDLSPADYIDRFFDTGTELEHKGERS